MGRLVGKVLREQPDVVAPHPQWRQIDPHHVDPVVEITAELATFHHLVDVAGGRGHHADVDGVFLAGAHPPHPSLLEHAEQFGLERQRQFAHLVEEQRAAVGELDEAHPAGIGAREGPALVAEELALDQRVGNRPAINRHERALCPPAAGVNRPGHEFLAGARLTRHQHIDGARRDPFDDRVDMLHGRALAEKVGERVRPLDGPPQHLLGGPTARGLEQPLQGVLQVGLDAGDVEVVAGARMQACPGGINARLRVDDHHRQLRIGLVERRVEHVGRGPGSRGHHAEIPRIAGE